MGHVEVYEEFTMQDAQPYEPPTLTPLGTLAELTQGAVGTSADTVGGVTAPVGGVS